MPKMTGTVYDRLPKEWIVQDGERYLADHTGRWTPIPVDAMRVTAAEAKGFAGIYGGVAVHGAVAWDRDESEPCERGTVGCSVLHAGARNAREADNVGCQTW